MERITHRKLETKISLRFQDSSKISDVISRIRTNLQNITKLDYSSQPFRVSFVGFGQYCLEIEILAYFATKSLDEFLYLQEMANIEILKAVYESGAKLALPTTQMIANVQQAPPVVVYAQRHDTKSSDAYSWNPSNIVVNAVANTTNPKAEIHSQESTEAAFSSQPLPVISHDDSSIYTTHPVNNEASMGTASRVHGMNMMYEVESFWEKYDYYDDL